MKPAVNRHEIEEKTPCDELQCASKFEELQIEDTVLVKEPLTESAVVEEDGNMDIEDESAANTNTEDHFEASTTATTTASSSMSTSTPNTNEDIDIMIGSHSSNQSNTSDVVMSSKENVSPQDLTDPSPPSTTSTSAPSTSQRPTTSNRMRRKRRYSEIQTEEAPVKSQRRRKKRRRSGVNKAVFDDADRQSVIVTPSIRNRARTKKKKIVSTTARRTVKRSRRGSGCMGSGKRPLRLVVDDQKSKKKKKGDPLRSSRKHANTPLPPSRSRKRMKPSLHSAATTPVVPSGGGIEDTVFAMNPSTVAVTDSAKKAQRGKDWEEKDKANKRIMLSRKARRRRKSKANRTTTKPPLSRSLHSAATTPSLGGGSGEKGEGIEDTVFAINSNTDGDRLCQGDAARKRWQARARRKRQRVR